MGKCQGTYPVTGELCFWRRVFACSHCKAFVGPAGAWFAELSKTCIAPGMMTSRPLTREPNPNHRCFEIPLQYIRTSHRKQQITAVTVAFCKPRTAIARVGLCLPPTPNPSNA